RVTIRPCPPLSGHSLADLFPPTVIALLTRSRERVRADPSCVMMTGNHTQVSATLQQARSFSSMSWRVPLTTSGSVSATSSPFHDSAFAVTPVVDYEPPTQSVLCQQPSGSALRRPAP